MEGKASISSDILARYAADAALEVPGVRGVVGSALLGSDELSVEMHVAVEWGASIPAVGRDVQRRVGETLIRMADVRPAAVDVVVDEIA